MLTHLRKQEADDVFDALMGSVAYQGAQDVLWVLERKPKDDFAFLHIRDKDAEEKTIALRLSMGTGSTSGKAKNTKSAAINARLSKYWLRKKSEMGIDEIRKAANWRRTNITTSATLLVAMVKDDMIHRTKYGKYSATIRATQEMMPESDDNDAVPF